MIAQRVSLGVLHNQNYEDNRKYDVITILLNDKCDCWFPRVSLLIFETNDSSTGARMWEPLSSKLQIFLLN
jgi:hypothetical protein